MNYGVKPKSLCYTNWSFNEFARLRDGRLLRTSQNRIVLHKQSHIYITICIIINPCCGGG